MSAKGGPGYLLDGVECGLDFRMCATFPPPLKPRKPPLYHCHDGPRGLWLPHLHDDCHLISLTVPLLEKRIVFASHWRSLMKEDWDRRIGIGMNPGKDHLIQQLTLCHHVWHGVMREILKGQRDWRVWIWWQRWYWAMKTMIFLFLTLLWVVLRTRMISGEQDDPLGLVILVGSLMTNSSSGGRDYPSNTSPLEYVVGKPWEWNR